MTNEAATFEAAMRRLEEIVTRLEQGDVPLEETIALVREGVDLRARCAQLLAAAERELSIAHRAH